MTRNLITLCTLITLLAARPGSAAEEKPMSRNAALIYWQAFEQLRELQADDKNGKENAKLISDYDTVSLDEKVAALMQGNSALELLHIAVAMPDCDWGTGLLMRKQGPGVLLPHLGRARALARLAALRARWHLGGGRAGQAIDDIVAIYAMGRHLEQEGIVISVLVGIATDSLANDFIATHMGSFADADLRLLQQKLEAMPRHLLVSAAIKQEREGMCAWLRAQIESGDGKAMRDLLRATGDPLAAPLFAAGKERLLEMVKEMEGLYDEVIPLLDLSLDEFRPKAAAWVKRVEESKNPLAMMLLPAMVAIREAQARTETSGLLLRAGIAYRLEGQDKFDGIKDPYGQGPFTLVKTDTGFEVKSQLVLRGQAVSMKFVTKGKEEKK